MINYNPCFRNKITKYITKKQIHRLVWTIFRSIDSFDIFSKAKDYS